MTVDPKGSTYFCAAVPDAWHVMGVTQAAGLSLKWFCDNFCVWKSRSRKKLGVDTLSDWQKSTGKKNSIGCNRLIYLPYLMGRAHTTSWPRLPRYVFSDLAQCTTKSDMIRAVMEGVTPFAARPCWGYPWDGYWYLYYGGLRRRRQLQSCGGNM